MKVAMVQMNSQPDPQRNLLLVEHFFREAAAAGASLITFPENFLAMGAGSSQIAHTDWQAIIERLQSFCREYAIACIAGTLPLPHPDAAEKRRYASALVIAANGEIMGGYQKIHLFDAEVGDGVGVYRESDEYCPGTLPLVVELGGMKIGLAVCFDLRFPTMFVEYRREGVELFVIPSAFTRKTGALHWELLLRARAIEGQCYVVAPGQCGTHGDGRETYGHSLAVSPLGEVMADLGEEPGVVVVELDRELVAKTRRAMPMRQPL